MISIISTGALTVNTRGSLLHWKKGKDKEGTELIGGWGGGGGSQRSLL